MRASTAASSDLESGDPDLRDPRLADPELSDLRPGDPYRRTAPLRTSLRKSAAAPPGSSAL